MEWMIMDCNGLNGLCGNLGSMIDGHYQIAEDCHGKYWGHNINKQHRLLI